MRAISPDEFKTWLADKKREIDEANKAALARRTEDAEKAGGRAGLRAPSRVRRGPEPDSEDRPTPAEAP